MVNKIKNTKNIRTNIDNANESLDNINKDVIDIGLVNFIE